MTAEITAAEFQLWVDELTQANQHIQEDLNKPDIEDEILREHFDDLALAQRELEQFRPTTKKQHGYNFTEALPIITTAKKLSLRVSRKLKLTSPPTPQITSQHATSRKIPELQVPQFDGDITMLSNFLKAFQMKFGELPISNSERLVHLQKLLTGGPKTMIASLAITDENYERAIEILRSQYEYEKDVISALYEKLNRIPTATSNTATLSTTYYEIAGILSALESHGQTIDAFPPLLDMVRAKYPFHVIQQVSGNRELPLSTLQQEILKYIQLKQKFENTRSTTRQVTASSTHGVSASLAVSKHEHKKPKSSDNQQASGPTSIKTIPPCAFCAELHYSSACPTHTSLEIRRSLLKNRCHNCLKPGHIQKHCRRKVSCFYCRESTHHSALCPKQFGKPSPVTLTNNENVKSDATASADNSKASYFLRTHKGAHVTALVSIENPETKKIHQIRALLDTGSNETYIAEAAARRIGIKLTNFRNVPVTVFLKDQPVNLHTATTTFLLTNKRKFCMPIVADTTKSLPQVVQLFDYSAFKELYPHYADLNYIDQAETKPIELLIGSDYYYDIVQNKTKIADGLYLQNTHYGWMLVGRQPCEVSEKATYFQMSPKEAIHQLCNLESLGIKEMPLSEIEEEEKALQQFYSNLTFKNDRYEIRWPWRHFPPRLPTNFGLAVGRLKSLQRKLTEESFADYNEILESQLKTGIVAEVPPNDISKIKHYIPHHVVVTPEKSTSNRIVYDGSAKIGKQKSINEEIYKGVNLLADSCKIIIRWRLRSLVIISDLEKAFHQLAIHEDDTLYVCFLWIRNLNQPASGNNLRFLRFLRVIFGIVASPFLLQAVIKFHLKKYKELYPKIVQKLLEDGFVDNFPTGFETYQEALQFYEAAVKIFQDCSMNLRKWASNNPKLRKIFVQPDKSEAISVLGIIWNQYTDKIKLKTLTFAENDTLRTVLSTTAQFFDPCGCYSPLLVSAKLFLREIHTKYAWDDELSDDDRLRWHTIRNELQVVASKSLSRFQTSIEDTTANFTLHVFTDASAKACACVVYLRKENSNNISTYLIFSKTKLAKISNIPKLELLAVLLGIQALAYVRNTLQIQTKSYLWCDSKCVLTWLHTDKILPVFIERQVQKINAIPSVEKRYVPSEMNAADLPSRGGNLSDLTESWFNGPPWLNSTEEHWPPALPFNSFLENSDLVPDELQPKTIAVITAQKYPFNINTDTYTNYTKLLRITFYLMSFLSAFTIFRQREIFQNTTLHTAQMLWVKFEQTNHFSDIISALKTTKKHPLINKFNIYEDRNEILRCAGRLQLAPLTINERNPILLPSPKVSPFTALLIKHYHELSYHSGTGAVLCAIRRKFWIIAGRRAIQTIIRKCPKCRKYNARPFNQPQHSQLPPFRLADHITPFTHIGIDMFGPIWAQTEKRYVLLVTDLVIRAIDLELVDDMTADKIFLSFRTIIARRSIPTFIVSDNAPQFTVIRDTFAKFFTHQWDWKFIPPHSPWMGGVYERLVALTKAAIIRNFGNTAMTDYVLRTALVEITTVLNQRPLTYVSNERENEPLTPNHFLTTYFKPENNMNSPPAFTTENATPTHSHLIAIAKCCNANTDRFWAIWRTHYLQFLREKGFTNNPLFKRQTARSLPKIGDVVLIAEPNIKRNQWKLGRITQLKHSADGLIRSVILRTQHGNLIRPLNELYPIEIAQEEISTASDETPSDSGNIPQALEENQSPDDDWDSPEISCEIIEDN